MNDRPQDESCTQLLGGVDELCAQVDAAVGDHAPSQPEKDAARTAAPADAPAPQSDEQEQRQPPAPAATAEVAHCPSTDRMRFADDGKAGRRVAARKRHAGR